VRQRPPRPPHLRLLGFLGSSPHAPWRAPAHQRRRAVLASHKQVSGSGVQTSAPFTSSQPCTGRAPGSALQGTTCSRHGRTNSDASRCAEKAARLPAAGARCTTHGNPARGGVLSAKPCEAPAPPTCRARRAGPAGCAPHGGATRRRRPRRLIRHRGRLSSAQAGSIQDHVQRGDARREGHRCGRAHRALPRALRASGWWSGAGRLQADGVRAAVSSLSG
jgi:hypothetical protein